jgi:hypothetical protein
LVSSATSRRLALGTVRLRLACSLVSEASAWLLRALAASAVPRALVDSWARLLRVSSLSAAADSADTRVRVPLTTRIPSSTANSTRLGWMAQMALFDVSTARRSPAERLIFWIHLRQDLDLFTSRHLFTFLHLLKRPSRRGGTSDSTLRPSRLTLLDYSSLQNKTLSSPLFFLSLDTPGQRNAKKAKRATCSHHALLISVCLLSFIHAVSLTLGYGRGSVELFHPAFTTPFPPECSISETEVLSSLHAGSDVLLFFAGCSMNKYRNVLL